MINSAILVSLGALIFSLAVYIFFRYQKGLSIIFLCLFLLGLSFLAVIQGAVFSVADSNATLWLTKAGYFFGIITFSFLLMFSWYFPIPSKEIPRQVHLFWVVPISFFPTFIFLSTSSINGIERAGNLITEKRGQLFWVIPVFICSYLILSFVNLIKKKKYLDGKQQKNLKIFFFTLLVTSGIGLVFDVILPSLGYSRLPLGIYSASVLFGLVAYIVLKK